MANVPEGLLKVKEIKYKKKIFWMHLENNLSKILETTNFTDMGFYYLQMLLVTAWAGPDLALGMQWGLAARGHEWRWGGRGGCSLQITKLTACERMENLCLTKKVPWGLKARLACHPHTKGALIGEYLMPWCHLSLGSNTSQQGWYLH